MADPLIWIPEYSVLQSRYLFEGQLLVGFTIFYLTYFYSAIIFV
jgi:hypothetical protein